MVRSKNQSLTLQCGYPDLLQLRMADGERLTPGKDDTVMTFGQLRPKPPRQLTKNALRAVPDHRRAQAFADHDADSTVPVAG